MISFQNEELTLGVSLEEENEERIYIRVLQDELRVSCSVDTDKNYLSRYAYFTLYHLLYYHNEYDFQYLYWPGFFDPKTGTSKYLMISKSKNKLLVFPKVRYKGWYKLGAELPVLAKYATVVREVKPVIVEKQLTNNDVVLGFCLANGYNQRFTTSHYPFLLPYTATLNKNKTAIKGFITSVLSEMNLPEINLSDQQQRLIEICFAMKGIALVESPAYKEEAQALAEKNERNNHHFKQLFELWQQALPMLAGRLYTHYRYTFGMRYVKGKPRKSDMIPCTFSNEVPKICFLWIDRGDYYKLELRLMIGKRSNEVYRYYNSPFFIATSVNPRNYFLLNSLTDCDLVKFFHQSQYQLLFLKTHFDGYCQSFVEQLRAGYQFVKR